MFYWNKENFEGLKAVGEEYSSKEGFECFSNYCLLKEQGLKKKAVEEINKFVSSLESNDIHRNREIALEFVELEFWNRSIHQLLSHPLRMWIISIFEKWVEEPNHEAHAERWLGYLKHDIEGFEKALEIDPNDQISLSLLASAYLNDVDYQTHHLSESQLIGELEDAKDSIQEAEKLLKKLVEESLKKKRDQELVYYKRLVGKWEEYTSLSVSESFPEWCEKQGEKFNFWSIVYYEE